jgi:nifR3 family TIM-barrel protein
MLPDKTIRGAPKKVSGLLSRARNPFWMAPMAGITEVCHRQIMDEMGAGVVVSDLVSAKGLLYGSTKTMQMIAIRPRMAGEPLSGTGALVGIQLFGEEADDIIVAARMVREAGADFVDINLGGPVKKVVKKGCGAALMRDPGYMEKFLSKIKNNIDLPLTVKMRTGWSEAELTVQECAQAAYNAGCEWVVIHGRHRAQGYEGKANWDLIRETKIRAKIPIIGNGDIHTAEQACSRLNDTGVDAVMIGRGALRNPWIFKECAGESGDNLSPTPVELIQRYIQLLQANYDTRRCLLMARKFAVWMTHGYPGSAAFRAQLFQTHSSDGISECAGEFFSRIPAHAISRFDESEAFMMGGHG